MMNDASRSYDRFVEEKVVSAKIYQKARVLLTAKAIPATVELFEKQKAYTPSHTFDYRADRTQVVVGLSIATSDIFTSDDLKFFLSGKPSVKQVEMINLTDIEHHYAFAYPFLRVFLVDFEKDDQEVHQLAIHSPVGPVELSLNFSMSDAGANAKAQTPSSEVKGN